MKITLPVRARLATLAAIGASSVLAADIGPLGTGIIGVNDAVDGDNGIPHANAGVAHSINDSDLTTRVDNWFGADPAGQGQGVSYVGVVWPSTRYESVTSLALMLATFLDGGWFGPNNSGPGAGGTLTPDYLIEPTVQVTTDGTNWVTASHTSDYMSVMNGFGIGGGANPNPTAAVVTFTLDTPATAIRGVRIIGQNGGTADGNGFIGVYDLTVNADPGADTDGDGLPDAWEQAHGLNVGTDDSAADPDSDGLSNIQEFNNSTDPYVADTDGDGLSDGDEVNVYATNPTLADTDSDGLNDGAEVNTYHSDPNLTDTDGDSLPDGAEVNTYHTNPILADSDNDGYSDSAEISQGSDPNDPSVIPNNVAIFGRGFMGVKDSVDSGVETESELYHVGTAENIVDGDLNTRVDTYNDADTSKHASFVGVIWDSEMTNTIATVRVTFATFLDGGWFGPNGVGPGAGNPLKTNQLSEPQVEVTTDGGASWNVVPATSDYMAVMTGHRVGGGTQPNPTAATATFTLTTPTNGINGIRLVGSEGGQASGGFIGISDFAALTSSTDVDNDGLDDAWERQHGLSVGTNDAAADPDADGLTNLQEFQLGTDPQVADTDGDGLNDGAEVNTHHTNPLQADTDGDGLSDGAEVNTHHTNPLAVDSDADGYNDGVEVAQGTDPANVSSFPSNIAPLATAILGSRGTIDDGTDVPYANSGSTTFINDFDPNSRVDTFGATPGQVSYVGLIWNQPLTNPLARLELTMAIFFDGGWFGPNGVGPGSGSVLTSNEFLIEPIVQVTSDKGTNWQTVSVNSDYLDVFDGQPTPAQDFGDPTRATATFQFTTPQTGINGARIVGSEGGTASGGFIGVFELAAYTGTNTTTGQVTIQKIALAGSQIGFDVPTIAGKSHVVQYKNDLTDASWQTLTTLTGDGTPQHVTDPTSGTRRFYRVMTQ
jgi:hypothetical protein